MVKENSGSEKKPITENFGWSLTRAGCQTLLG